MRNDKIKIICATRDLQTLPLLQTATFSQTPPSSVAWSTLCTSVIQRRSDCYSPIQELCLCWPFRLDNPCIWNYYLCPLSSRRDYLRLSGLLTKALMPLRFVRDHC